MIVIGDQLSRFFFQVFGECDGKSTGARAAWGARSCEKCCWGSGGLTLPTKVWSGLESAIGDGHDRSPSWRSASSLHFAAIHRALLAFGVDLLLFVLVHFLDHGIAAGLAGGLVCRGWRCIALHGGLARWCRRRPCGGGAGQRRGLGRRRRHIQEKGARQ